MQGAKGSVKFIDTIVTASPEFFKRRSVEETEKYFKHALEFLQEEVGADNIFSAVVHMDERNPHMHLCFVPLTKDKRLSAKEIMGDRNKLIEWQDKFHEHMIKEFTELERGESATVTKLFCWSFLTAHNTDQGLLCQVAKSSKEVLEVETIEAVADKGYESREDILNCVMNGIVPNVALKYDKDERLYTIDYEEAEITENIRNSTKPEDIQKCIKAGVLPKCYESTAIEVELQEQSELSCFTLNEDGTVTCPIGKILSRTKIRGKNTIYGSKDACRQCPNKCTGSKNHKTVSFGPETKYVPVRMYGSPRLKLNPIPVNILPNPFNHTFDRKDYAPPRKVILRIKEDIPKIKERMCLSEHPFGTVKWHHGAHYLLCKGKEKATAELGLSFLAYNMRRAINMVGVKKLIEAM
ncbi:MAG: MobV family relaxase [Ruminiclostridium sp.]